ncbi:hypothetical protein [Sphaerisporangium corydalis]|uniref:HEAT repeat domain-containing protein n=1 Tax=Sphaerisporangium corydalis TaxID=1441875 RepID=A0ABV9ERK1_9ACTN|nr:hypothetical protein [Sphaerisporangium corydalis]
MSEPAPPPEKKEPKEPEQQNQDGEQHEPEERKASNLGRELAARAAQPGTVQDRLDTEADAISSFASAKVRAENVAGGDMHIYYQAVSETEDAPRLMRLQPADLAEAEELFVAPTGFAALREAMATGRVVFVRADADRGKFMTARRLLLGCPAVFRLDPQTRPAALTADTLIKGGGYILADLPGATARELTAYEVAKLTAVLEECDARLVVTLVTGRRLTDPEVAALVMDLGEVTDRVEVIYRHLRKSLDGEAIDRIFDNAELMALVQEELSRDASPRHAAILAQFAAEASQAGGSLFDAVRERLGLRSDSDFQDWAEGLPDLPTQSMALAVAVLGGEPYETVAAAAYRLQRGLEPETPLESAERPRLAPLAGGKSQRLRKLRAHVTPSTVQTWHGGAPTQAVRYRDEGFQRKYLLYFWNEYDEARPRLLNWLRLCATHELESVRVRAAVATGVLAVQSFDNVRATVIRPWAESDEPDLRDAAARALRTAGETDPDLRAPIRNLVHAWSADASPALQATAARSWRIEYAAAGAGAALKALEKLSSSEDLDVTMAVCNSITEMWEIEGERLEAPATLLAWLDDRGRKPAARLAFLLTAADLVRKVDGVIWPALLYIATCDPVRHREIAALWRDAVTAPRLHPYAKTVLAEWAHAVNDRPHACRSLALLLATVAEEPRSATIVAHEAAKWAKGTRRAPTASVEVLRLISPESRRP